MDDSGLSGIQRSASKAAGREPGRTVDDSAVQSTLSVSFSRTVQDWERVRQSRGKSQSVSAATATATPQPAVSTGKPSSSTPAADVRSKSRDRDKSRQRAEKELSKLVKKEQKLEEEMRLLAAARSKLEAQLESSSASDRGAESGSRGDSDRGVSADDERLLVALDLLENVDDRTSIAFSQRQPRGRSKSSRVRRQSCMMPSTGFQRATTIGEPGRMKTLSQSGTVGITVDSDSDNRRNQPAKHPPR